jgi:hypothetical protein
VASDRDVAGREGIAVAYDYDGHRRALVFDRDSYRLLGETERRLASAGDVDGAPGRLIGGSAYVESGIVASDTQRP